jgi:2-ketocyclohexanecarboxyl-CoA hydrolase
VRRWADEILAKSPTAIKVLKHSFNADSESIAGLGALSFDTLDLFLESDEAQEGIRAYTEKRPPDFSPYR